MTPPGPMRYFFRRRIPRFTRVLLVESGARHLFEKYLPGLYDSHAGDMIADVVTCYADHPAAFRTDTGAVYQVNDYAGRAGRRRLYRRLAANNYTVAIVICSGEPIMTKWKWMLAARLPVKVLVVNENCDYFWLDWGHWRIIRHFILFRAGLSGAGAVRTLGRFILFPFTLAYLLFYTAIVHLRRKAHL